MARLPSPFSKIVAVHFGVDEGCWITMETYGSPPEVYYTGFVDEGVTEPSFAVNAPGPLGTCVQVRDEPLSGPGTVAGFGLAYFGSQIDSLTNDPSSLSWWVGFYGDTSAAFATKFLKLNGDVDLGVDLGGSDVTDGVFDGTITHYASIAASGFPPDDPSVISLTVEDV